MKPIWQTSILSLALATLAGAQAPETAPAGAGGSATPDRQDAMGKLVVCFASKGDYKQTPGTKEGLQGLAGLLHKYGYRGTYFLKPSTVADCQAELQEWNKAHGDEVGWFSDGDSQDKAGDELKKMRELLPGQKIRAAGHMRYNASWVKFFEDNGVESVWGRCYEQSATDGITDRGCPFGFYYAKPDCFKVPNTDQGGVISVPWLSNDLNLVFRTAQQSTFTFDPNDSQDIGISTPDDDSFWRAELNEYKKQTRYNKIVPLVIQQEIGEFEFGKKTEWKKAGAAIFENLLKILKAEGIQVVTVSEAVDLYKAANPTATPPTYGVFGNIAATTPIIKSNRSLQPVTEPFAIARKDQFKCYGPTFNGCYATGRVGRTWYYYDPKGETLDQFGKNISYYDKNGLVIFTEGDSSPVRITPYSNLPQDAFHTAILPELSHWFDTAKFIPKADVKATKSPSGLTVAIKATMIANTIYTGATMPYGVVLWGDYSAYVVPDNAPVGTKILASDGIFIPMLLIEGENSLSVDFPVDSRK
jgi:hypothetical protein